MADDCVTFVPFSHYAGLSGGMDGCHGSEYLGGICPSSSEADRNSPTAYCLIASFCAVAYWMSIELLVLVYVTFSHSGVYFWSIITTTLGIILQTTGYILKSFENPAPDILTTIICKVGWVSNVTGFSIVL